MNQHRPLSMLDTIHNGVAKPAPVDAPTHKLVDEKTGEEITLPACLRTWDGIEITVHAFKPSRFEGNPGYIYAEGHPTYVPSVVGAKIVRAS